MGLHKMDFLVAETGADAVDMMRTIKRALDPKNIINPGKIFFFGYLTKGLAIASAAPESHFPAARVAGASWSAMLKSADRPCFWQHIDDGRLRSRRQA